MSRIFVFIFLSLLLPELASAQIYADVTVSGAVAGTFTINLEYQKAPVAVANFIGLATGSKAWLDPATGNIRHDPFYNGLTFHRVIKDDVTQKMEISQTGSPNGQGTDGPGYTFKNEIDQSGSDRLTCATPYTVGMANSGGAYTNGSQWFITGTLNQNSFDPNYTIFGVVTSSGTSLCNQLNSVFTVADVPNPSVVITSVTVHGPSLATFNLTPNGLPKVYSANPVMHVSGSTYSLGYDHNLHSYYHTFDTSDLLTWKNQLSNYWQAPPAGDLNVTSISGSNGKHFFRMARIDYGLSCNPLVLDSLAGRILHFSAPLGGYLVVNSANTAAAWLYDGQPESTTYNYSYAANPYFGVIYFSFIYSNTNFNVQINRLEPSSATGGTYSGAAVSTSGTTTLSGSYTVSP